MIVVAFFVYLVLGLVVLAMIDDFTKGRLKAWADSAPGEILKWVVLLVWPIVYAMFLYYELREALRAPGPPREP